MNRVKKGEQGEKFPAFLCTGGLGFIRSSERQGRRKGSKRQKKLRW